MVNPKIVEVTKEEPDAAGSDNSGEIPDGDDLLYDLC